MKRSKLVIAVSLLISFPALAGPALQEGQVIENKDIEVLQDYLPKEIWKYRDQYLFSGMKMTIGPKQRDYSPAKVYVSATKRYSAAVRIGNQGQLLNYKAGMPFPSTNIACRADTMAGFKYAWNFVYQWQGDGSHGRYYFSYFDKGIELPLYYKGSAHRVQLIHRAEPQYAKKGGSLFKNEKRRFAFGFSIAAPYDLRETRVKSFRYMKNDTAIGNDVRTDDIWAYSPRIRRVRRMSYRLRSSPVVGTEFSFNDLNGFDDIVPNYDWKCLEERTIIAPMNTMNRGYPYEGQKINFGPYQISYASDRWELRQAIRIRITPKRDSRYSHKEMVIDKETMVPMYTFIYAKKDKKLLRIITHNSRWSEDNPEWYPAWQGVKHPRDLRVISESVLNVRSFYGNRIDSWDTNGTPKKKSWLRKFLSVSSLEGAL